MDAAVAWYIAKCLMAFSVGWCAGLVHKSLAQVVDAST